MFQRLKGFKEFKRILRGSEVYSTTLCLSFALGIVIIMPISCQTDNVLKIIIYGHIRAVPATGMVNLQPAEQWRDPELRY